MGSEGSMSGKEWNEQYLSEPSWEVSAPPPHSFSVGYSLLAVYPRIPRYKLHLLITAYLNTSFFSILFIAFGPSNEMTRTFQIREAMRLHWVASMYAYYGAFTSHGLPRSPQWFFFWLFALKHCLPHFLTFRNEGKTTWVTNEVARAKLPQKLLNFYEDVRFILSCLLPYFIIPSYPVTNAFHLLHHYNSIYNLLQLSHEVDTVWEVLKFKQGWQGDRFSNFLACCLVWFGMIDLSIYICFSVVLWRWRRCLTWISKWGGEGRVARF